MRLVLIALGWCTGIVVSSRAPNMNPALWLVLAAALTVIVWLTRHDRLYRTINLALLAFALGALRVALIDTSSPIAAYNNTGGLTIEGVIEAEPDERDDRIQFRLRAEMLVIGGRREPITGAVLVRAPQTDDLRYGDRVAATGLLITPAEFDTFSYADYLARSGIYSIMTNATVRIIEPASSSLPGMTIELRQQAQARIAAAIPEPAAGLLTGILLGDERWMSPELTDDFSAVGASHIIAISGFNMAIIAGVLTGSLKRITTQSGLIALIGVAVLAFYTLLVGASPAVVRAAVMSSLLVIGEALRRNAYVPASLGFAALIMSALNPNVLFDIGFQLSFLATIGLALFADPLSRRFDALLFRSFPAAIARTLSAWLTEPLIVTLAVQITTLPLIMAVFGRLSLVFLPVNLLIIPVQAALMILGLAGVIIAFLLPALGQLVLWLTLILLTWTIGVVRFFADLPFAQADFSIGERVIVIYFVVLSGWVIMNATQPEWWIRAVRLIRSRAALSAVTVSGLGIALLMGAMVSSRPDGRLHVWFLDLGHSNAVLAQTPGGAHILIDGGRFPSRLLTAVGDRLPFYDRRIEVLVITQPDEFDTSALTALLDRYDAGVILTNGQDNLGAAYQELSAAAARFPVQIVQAGYTVDFSDGTQLEVLHPPSRPQLEDSLDDHAVVLRLSYGNVSFLLTSDLSQTGQIALLDNGLWPTATVMQLPQHATARSLNEEFLRAAQPLALVVQIDPANRRGDPNPDVLALLGAAPLFRTDQQDGPVYFWTDGDRLFADP
jgi:competence protein ComEC